MKQAKPRFKNTQTKISKVEMTTDTLSGRGGLALFVRYLQGTRVLKSLEKVLSFVRVSKKGQSVSEMIKQLFCFFVDGTSRHISYFDDLKKDEGYGSVIESSPSTLLSSWAIKRFFAKFKHSHQWVFRKGLQQLFLWRLRIEKPKEILLGIDTMVMDNDEALKREGVNPTYKKKKGFQNLQMTWRRLIVDAIFRSGEKHSNYADHTPKMIQRVSKFIREHYDANVPIVICLDSGFFDQKLFECCEKLGVGYICGGKIYQDIKDKVLEQAEDQWGQLKNNKQVWSYVEFQDQRGNWKKERRAIFCHPLYDDEQLLLDFARPDTLIYTNLGRGEKIDEQLIAANRADLLETQNIVKAYHDRGADELVHRAIKDFASETLPFKRFNHNMAFYFMMVMAFFLFETFKEDVTQEVIAPEVYATTFRRRLIDIAVKVVKGSNRLILRVTQQVWRALNFKQLWQRAAYAPVFLWAG